MLGCQNVKYQNWKVSVQVKWQKSLLGLYQSIKNKCVPGIFETYAQKYSYIGTVFFLGQKPGDVI